MPLYRQPESLRVMSIRFVSELVQTACLNIIARHPRSKEECFVEVASLQEYLVLRVRPLLDEICNETFTNGDSLTLRNAGSLLLATFMHKHMKVLNYSYDPAKCTNSSVWGIDLWEKFFQNVPKLVELDLSGVGNNINGILQVLGRSNVPLEIITLFGYEVSQHGLLNLANIKTLREIRNFYADSLYLTRAGNDLPCIRILLQMLPLLEHIHCCCIGDALINLTHLETLALRRCCEMQPTTQKMQAIARLCPNLARLELGYPVINEQRLEFGCLTESILTMSSLKLVEFSFTEDLNYFIMQKGKYLTTLELVNFHDITLDKIKLIGKFCKGIEIFRMYLDPDCKRLHRKPVNPTVKKYKDCRLNEHMFENLLQFELEMYADDCSDETGLLMCLIYARDIQFFTFRKQTQGSNGDDGTLERILHGLFMWNPMLELRSLVLLGPFKLSVDTIQYFYNLPQLSKLTLYIVHTDLVDEYLENLESEVHKKNVNLDMSIWLSSRL